MRRYSWHNSQLIQLSQLLNQKYTIFNICQKITRYGVYSKVTLVRESCHNSNVANVDLSKYSLLVKMSTNMNTNQRKCAVYFKSHIQTITITSQHGTCATYSNMYR